MWHRLRYSLPLGLCSQPLMDLGTLSWWQFVFQCHSEIEVSSLWSGYHRKLSLHLGRMLRTWRHSSSWVMVSTRCCMNRNLWMESSTPLYLIGIGESRWHHQNHQHRQSYLMEQSLQRRMCLDMDTSCKRVIIRLDSSIHHHHNHWWTLRIQ
jgi:hypothetical protein